MQGNNNKTLSATYTLSNGVKMPAVGFGTYRLEPGAKTLPIIDALEAGYKMFDMATYYQVHRQMAEALKKTHIDRKELFLVSKIWNVDEGCGVKEALKDLEEMFADSEQNYFDLVLIHWPAPNSLEIWKILEEWYDAKKIRAIGVSNFTGVQLADFYSKVRIKPMVDQIQLSPLQPRIELVETCKKLNVVPTAWRTIGSKELLEDPIINQIAKNHNATPAQICLKWAIQRDVVVIPKSSHRERVIENSMLDNITLSEDEMHNITQHTPKAELYWPVRKDITRTINW